MLFKKQYENSFFFKSNVLYVKYFKLRFLKLAYPCTETNIVFCLFSVFYPYIFRTLYRFLGYLEGFCTDVNCAAGASGVCFRKRERNLRSMFLSLPTCLLILASDSV